MKVHVGLDANLGLVFSAVITAANALDVTQADALLSRDEADLINEPDYRSVNKHEEIQT